MDVRRRKHAGERWRRLVRRMGVSWKWLRMSLTRWMAIGCAVLGALTVGFLLFSPIVEVREIQVTRESPRLDIEQVQQALAPIFGRRMLFLSSFEVMNLLKESLPDVSTITVRKIYPSILHVALSLHPLVAKLHITDPDAEQAVSGTGGTVDYLTDQGIYVVTVAAQNTETLPAITLVDWGVRPEPGTVLIDPFMLERMKAAELTLLRQFGQEVQERIIFVRSQEFHFRIAGRELWFDLRSTLKEHMDRYRIFLRDAGGSARTYIDLRVEDRVMFQ